MNPKVRPKTGLKQKVLDEVSQVSMNEIDKYTDLLYEEKYEDKIKGAMSILCLMMVPQQFKALIEGDSNLLDVLSRTLREENKKSMELSIILLQFFNSYSYFTLYHQPLLSQSIGEICISVINYNNMKYDFRYDEMVRYSSNAEIKKNEYQHHLERFLLLVRKQDRILKLAFMILSHLAEDPKVEYKMVKKDIVLLVMNNLSRRELQLVMLLLTFLKKLSVFQVNKDTMIKNGILEKIMPFLKIKSRNLLDMTIQLIFNLSFDKKFRDKFLEKNEYFLQLVELFKEGVSRGLILRIWYNLSLEESSMKYFYESDVLFLIYELLDKFPEKIIGAELAALTLNLVSNSENADKIASEGRAKNLIERALKNSDFELIKIVKNIIKYSEKEEINDIYEKFINKHFMKIVLAKTENQEFLIEVIEILSYIKTGWDKKLEKHGLINFFETGLEETKYDDYLVAIISFLGNVANDRDCAGPIADSNIISLLYETLSKKIDNYSVVFGIIFILYELMGKKNTREKIMENSKLIELVISCLNCSCEQIVFICLRFLEILELFEKKWGDIIKNRKFELHNKEILTKIQKIKNAFENERMMMEQAGLMEEEGMNYFEDEDMYEMEGKG
ncbi:MAG: hypothetical protein MJ252_27930, partial [archaeon]|nr:hypothetical protein [archaeon]